jgi:hypothetical protein
MNIAFFSELPFNNTKLPKEYATRTDGAWISTLDATHYNIHNVASNMLSGLKYDLGIIIIPKNFSSLELLTEDIFQYIKPTCNKIAIMQEGPHWLYQDKSVIQQIEYLKILSNSDIILCHNDIDKKYFNGLFPGHNVFIMPSLMFDYRVPDVVRNGVLLGGNWTSWYSGVDSYLAAQTFNEPIYSVSMGRKQLEEKFLEDVTYLPYLPNTEEWINELNKYKYAVHLMRTYAAGTFPMNCAYLGIPCIGWNSCDTQRLLFPELSFNEGDMESVMKKAKHLRDNERFYSHVSNYAKKVWKDLYSEETFKNNFMFLLNTIL